MIWLHVLYKDKEEAKKHGARFDTQHKKWFWPGTYSDIPEALFGFYLAQQRLEKWGGRWK